MLKYFLLILFVFINIYGFFSMNINLIPLLKLNLILAVVPVIVIVLKNDPANLLLLWAFFAMFQKAGKVSLPMLPDISLSRFIFILIIMTLLFELVSGKRKNILSFTGTETAMVMLSVLSISSMVLNGQLYSAEEGLTLSTFLSGFGIPYTIFFISKNVIDSEERIKKSFKVFSFIGLYIGIIGILEYFQLRSLVFPSYIVQWRWMHMGRAVGPFLNATANGLVIGMLIPIAIYLLQESRKRLKLFYSAAVMVMLTTLLFTFQRASWLGFLLSSLLIPVFLPKVRKAFFAGFAVVIILIGTQFTADQLKPRTFTIADYQRTGSLTGRISGRLMSEGPVYGRLTLYGVVWRMFLDKPVFGFGFNSFFDESPKYFEKLKGIPYAATPGTNIHDTMSGILVELGMAGLGLYLFILFSIFKNSIQLYRRLPPGAFIGKGLVGIFWAIFIVFLVNTQFIQARLFLYPNALFFMLAGIISGLYQRTLLQSKVAAEKNVYSEQLK